MKMRSLIVLSVLLLTACGQKGPLYLPQQPAQPGTASSPAPAAATPGSAAPASNSDEQDKQEEKSQQHTEAEAVSK